jgi:hypothetical protein
VGEAKKQGPMTKKWCYDKKKFKRREEEEDKRMVKLEYICFSKLPFLGI